MSAEERLQKLLDHEGRRVDCGACRGPVYQFGNDMWVGMGPGRSQQFVPANKYDLDGSQHDCADQVRLV